MSLHEPTSDSEPSIHESQDDIGSKLDAQGELGGQRSASTDQRIRELEAVRIAELARIASEARTLAQVEQDRINGPGAANARMAIGAALEADAKRHNSTKTGDAA
jgi:hypothetical protein